jgi:hypothetical protein
MQTLKENEQDHSSKGMEKCAKNDLTGPTLLEMSGNPVPAQPVDATLSN